MVPPPQFYCVHYILKREGKAVQNKKMTNATRENVTFHHCIKNIYGIKSDRNRVVDVAKIRCSSPSYTEIGSSRCRPSLSIVDDMFYQNRNLQKNKNKKSKPLKTVHRKCSLFWRIFFPRIQTKNIFIHLENRSTLWLCLLTKLSSLIYLTKCPLPIFMVSKFLVSLLTNRISLILPELSYRFMA